MGNQYRYTVISTRIVETQGQRTKGVQILCRPLPVLPALTPRGLSAGLRLHELSAHLTSDKKASTIGRLFLQPPELDRWIDKRLDRSQRTNRTVPLPYG